MFSKLFRLDDQRLEVERQTKKKISWIKSNPSNVTHLSLRKHEPDDDEGLDGVVEWEPIKLNWKEERKVVRVREISQRPNLKRVKGFG